MIIWFSTLYDWCFSCWSGEYQEYWILQMINIMSWTTTSMVQYKDLHAGCKNTEGINVSGCGSRSLYMLMNYSKSVKFKFKITMELLEHEKWMPLSQNWDGLHALPHFQNGVGEISEITFSPITASGIERDEILLSTPMLLKMRNPMMTLTNLYDS